MGEYIFLPIPFKITSLCSFVLTLIPFVFTFHKGNY